MLRGYCVFILSYINLNIWDVVCFYCSYIISMVGNYIQQKPLQGQCCNILSKLLAAFDGNTSAETLEVLGRQLQVDFTNSNQKKNNCLMNFYLLSTSNSNWTVTGSSSKISYFLPNQWERRKKWYWRFIKSSFFTSSIDSGGRSSALWLHKSMLRLLSIYNCILSSY